MGCPPTICPQSCPRRQLTMDVVPVVRTATSRWISQFQSDAQKELSTVSVVLRPTFLSQTPGTVWAHDGRVAQVTASTFISPFALSFASFRICFHIIFHIIFDRNITQHFMQDPNITHIYTHREYYDSQPPQKKFVP